MTIKVYYDIQNIGTDLIVGLTESPATARVVVYNDVNVGGVPEGDYWIEKHIVTGLPVLCSNVSAFSNPALSMTDSAGNNPYTATASFFGGHPHSHPGGH